MRIAIVCSPGGHLTQALEVLEGFVGHELFLITVDAPNVRNFSHPSIARVYRIHLGPGRGFSLAVALLIESLWVLGILLRERPQIVFSTGAEPAVPAFYLGKFLFRTKLIFLETATRVIRPSLTAKIICPITDLLLVQWPSLLKALGHKARYEGDVL